jgi:hypothetical protein
MAARRRISRNPAISAARPDIPRRAADPGRRGGRTPGVVLPRRWLNGFAEVQLAAAGMTLAADLGQATARAFLRELPRAWRGPAWAVPAGSGLALAAPRAWRSPRRGPGAVCAAEPDRLRAAAEQLARFLTRLRVYAAARTDDLPAASAWELGLADAQASLDANVITALLARELTWSACCRAAVVSSCPVTRLK